MGELMLYMSFHDYHYAVSKMVFVHVVANIRTSFTFNAK